MKHSAYVIVLVCGGLALASLAARAADATDSKTSVAWMEKVYGDGRHNAFTDLVRWHGAYYLCFRSGSAHGSMDGAIIVLRSTDARQWEAAGVLDTYGDDRDPHFVALDDTLMVYFGVWDLTHRPGNALPDRHEVRSYMASTTDGTTWSNIQGVYEPGFWLWRVSRHGDAFYSAAYTARRPTPDVRETRLLRSTNGIDWELVSLVTDKHQAGEADLWWQPDGSIWLLTRAKVDASGEAFLFRSDPALKTWTGESVGTLVHSPVWAHCGDRHFLSGRGKGKEKGSNVTKIWEWKNGALEDVVTLPSAGDTGYSGLIAEAPADGTKAPALLVSWYSQHEYQPSNDTNRNKADIYVACVVPAP